MNETMNEQQKASDILSQKFNALNEDFNYFYKNNLELHKKLEKLFPYLSTDHDNEMLNVLISLKYLLSVNYEYSFKLNKNFQHYKQYLSDFFKKTSFIHSNNQFQSFSNDDINNDFFAFHGTESSITITDNRDSNSFLRGSITSNGSHVSGNVFFKNILNNNYSV